MVDCTTSISTYYDDIVHSHSRVFDCGHSWLTLLDVIDGAAHLQCVNAPNNDLHIKRERDFALFAHVAAAHTRAIKQGVNCGACDSDSVAKRSISYA